MPRLVSGCFLFGRGLVKSFIAANKVIRILRFTPGIRIHAAIFGMIKFFDLFSLFLSETFQYVSEQDHRNAVGHNQKALPIMTLAVNHLQKEQCAHSDLGPIFNISTFDVKMTDLFYKLTIFLIPPIHFVGITKSRIKLSWMLLH